MKIDERQYEFVSNIAREARERVEQLKLDLMECALAEHRVRERHRPMPLKPLGDVVCAWCWGNYEGSAVDVDYPCPTLSDVIGGP